MSIRTVRCKRVFLLHSMLLLVALCHAIAGVFPRSRALICLRDSCACLPIPRSLRSLHRISAPAHLANSDSADVLNYCGRHLHHRSSTPSQGATLGFLLSSHTRMFLTCLAFQPFRLTIICFLGVSSGSAVALRRCRRIRSLHRYTIQLIHPFLSLVISPFIPYRPHSGSYVPACTFCPFQGLSRPRSMTSFPYTLSAGLTIRLHRGATQGYPLFIVDAPVYPFVIRSSSGFPTLYLFRWYIELLALKSRLVVRYFVA